MIVDLVIVVPSKAVDDIVDAVHIDELKQGLTDCWVGVDVDGGNIYTS